MTQPTPVKPPAASMLRGLMGCGVLFLAFFVVAVIGAVVIPSKEVPEKPGSAATTARAKQHASTIVATIQDFQAGIPLLEQQGLARQQEPDGIDYRWTSSDGASWIRFYDSGADGKLDRISAVLATEGDQNASVIAGALSFRIVQLASGEDVSVDESLCVNVAETAFDPRFSVEGRRMISRDQTAKRRAGSSPGCATRAHG